MFTNDDVVAQGAVEQKGARELQPGFIDIEGLDKGQVLFALYSYAKGATSALFAIPGFSQTFGAPKELTDDFVALRMAIDPVKTRVWGEKGAAFKEFQQAGVSQLARAQGLVKQDIHFDRVNLGAGEKVLRVGFFQDSTFRAFAYDREHGAGRAKEAIDTLKEVLAAIANDRERDQRAEAEAVRAAQGSSMINFSTSTTQTSASTSSTTTVAAEVTSTVVPGGSSSRSSSSSSSCAFQGKSSSSSSSSARGYR
ncbi:MAG TPA: hypothetical protein VNK03_02630 [Gammaproteobacteria bacterium]|nr:hypothetical protein [Gammaproteobacteria bacterium]